MKTNIDSQIFSTDDKVIRIALRNVLDKEQEKCQKNGCKAEIFEEFGVRHGTARIDCAIINGFMCGYEIKSDRDSLKRLPGQVKEFSTVFDKLTLVVGKRHLYHAMHIIPDWWGVTVAKKNADGTVRLQTIRKPEQNKTQEEMSIARLLWREEALKILEQRNEACRVRHKPRESLYEKIVEVFASDIKELKKCISSALISREAWQSEMPKVLDGD